ncbi:MAG: putative transport system ATP-binding protein [Solirubrobacterales bacterium]|nr:putative transport system ATP-binding protein [Solirubrobacterales bacterium]
MLELRELVKHYPSVEGEVVNALDGLSMTVGAGELVALYGPSGSGKTTLLTIVAALMSPDSGQVLLDGDEVSGLPARQAARYRRLQLGYVSQAPDLLPGVSAIDNAALKLFALRLGVHEAHRRVTPLLERLGLAGRLHHRAEHLSAGQRQRVLLARALSTDPQLVLADEPTGSLDTQRSAEVLALLTGLCEEKSLAMLLVTHDPQAAGFAHRVHALRDGHLVEHRP